MRRTRPARRKLKADKISMAGEKLRTISSGQSR
jgi:hypothetical protein